MCKPGPNHLYGRLQQCSFLLTAFAFLSGASFILIGFLDVEPHLFGVYFLFIVAGYIGGNLFTAKVAYRWQPTTLFKLGIAIALLSSSAMVIFCLLQWYHPLFIVVPVGFSTLAVGLVLPQAMAEALKPFAHMAATASAVMGFLQMAIATFAGWLVGIYLIAEPLPLALVIFASAVAASMCYRFLLKR